MPVTHVRFLAIYISVHLKSEMERHKRFLVIFLAKVNGLKRVGSS